MSAGAVYDRFGPIVTYAGGAGVMLLVVAFGWVRAGDLRNLKKTVEPSSASGSSAPTPTPATAGAPTA